LYDGDDRLIQRILGARMKASTSSTVSSLPSSASSSALSSPRRFPYRIMKTVGTCTNITWLDRHDRGTSTEDHGTSPPRVEVMDRGVQVMVTEKETAVQWGMNDAMTNRETWVRRW